MITYKSCLATSDTYGETKDCTVKALAIACNQPYIKAHALLSKRGRINRHGANAPQYLSALSDLGFRAVHVPRTTAKTISSLHKQLDPSKRYIVEVSGHLLAYVNGTIEDWTGDPERKPSRKRIENIMVIEPLMSKNAIRKASRYNK